MNYDKWVKKIFCHEENVDIAPIRDDVEIDDIPTLSERDTLKMVTRLFESSEESLSGFSHKQVADGLGYLSNEIEDSLRGLYNIDISFEERLRAVRSVFSLFRDGFGRFCDDSMVDDSKNPVNSLCFMFWDASQVSLYLFATNPNDDFRDELADASIDILEEILMLPSIASQESALHGLGHAIMIAEGVFQNERKREIVSRIKKIIERYISEKKPAKKLLDYAHQAKTGMIL